MNSQVEQVDRLSYAAYIRMKIGVDTDESYISRLLNGEMDWTHGVQIARVARHRLASLASQPPVLDEREAIEPSSANVDRIWAGTFTNHPYSIGDRWVPEARAKAAIRAALSIRNLGGPDDVA